MPFTTEQRLVFFRILNFIFEFEKTEKLYERDTIFFMCKKALERGSEVSEHVEDVRKKAEFIIRPDSHASPEEQSTAYFHLGQYHHYFKQDYDQAVKCFEDAVLHNPNNTSAMVAHALICRDSAHVIKLLEQAMVLRDARAMNIRAALFDHDGNYSEAIAFYNRSSALGCTESRVALAMMSQKGKGTFNNEPNYPYAVAVLKKAIDLKSVTAMNNLAVLYLSGEGTFNGEPDYPSAIKFFYQGIDAEDPAAMNNRAEMYIRGQGTIPAGQPNYPAAIELLKRAIALGCSDAMNNYALMCIRGQGTLNGEPDYARAIEFLEQGIGLENGSAMLNRVDMYELGDGILDNPPNYQRAIELCARIIFSNSIRKETKDKATKKHRELVTKVGIFSFPSTSAANATQNVARTSAAFNSH